MDEYVIVEASLEHLPSIVKLVNNSYEITMGKYFEDFKRTTEDEIKDSMTKDVKFYIAIKDGKVIGNITYKEEVNIAVCGLFAIDDAHRHGKLGKKMMDHVKNVARKSGKEKISFSVCGFSERLINYYLSLGAEITEDTIPLTEFKLKPQYINDPRAKFILMKSKL